jgi:hypothetical protein
VIHNPLLDPLSDRSSNCSTHRIRLFFDHPCKFGRKSQLESVEGKKIEN